MSFVNSIWWIIVCINNRWWTKRQTHEQIYTVSRKKRYQNVFFVISPTKLKRYWRIWYTVSWINLLRNDVNIFHSPEQCLYTTSWNLKCSLRTCYVPLLPKETPEFIPLQLWSPNLLDLNPVANNKWEILQEKVYKTLITDLELLTMPLTNAAANDGMIQLGPLLSQSLFQFVQIMDVYFLHLLLQQSSHAVINQIQIWWIWRPQLRSDEF